MQTERLDFSQPANDLTAVADLQRKSLLVKNDYKNSYEKRFPLAFFLQLSLKTLENG